VILFRIAFEVDAAKSGQFQQMVEDVYGPALSRQRGFASWRLLAPYKDRTGDEGQETVGWQLEFEFATEQDRLDWAASADHAEAWAVAVGLAKSYEAHGFDVAGASA